MLNQNRNAAFVWSVEMCFSFVEHIKVIFMRPVYEAVILFDCIINIYILGTFTEKPCTKPLECNVVYTSIITLRHMMLYDIKGSQNKPFFSTI